MIVDMNTQTGCKDKVSHQVGKTDMTLRGSNGQRNVYMNAI